MKVKFNPIESITRGPRDTSMELLRIVAIFMVLVVHADFVALGVPAPLFGNFGQGTATLLRVIFEMMAIVCVNLFILISGWFGIRSSVRGFMNFIFQVIFFFLLSYLVMLSFSMAPFSGKELAACFCFCSSHWFIKAYAALYIFAPLLNMYAEKSSERTLRTTILLFFLYQTLWGFFSPNSSVANGYSALSFMGLYLLARYMRLYYRGNRSRDWLWLYLLTTALCCIAFFTFPEDIVVWIYSNPLVIIGSLALMMYFTTLKLPYNRWINFVAASSFGAYLLHSSTAVFPHFRRAVVAVYNATPGLLAIITVALLLAAFYALAILVDQPRIYIWNRYGAKASEFVERWFEKLTNPNLLRDIDLKKFRK